MAVSGQPVAAASAGSYPLALAHAVILSMLVVILYVAARLSLVNEGCAEFLWELH